uniref:Uncharacterized protein n=1 Tax=Anguilla anguilla TaxID=7936 RepID=A0A0E9WP85_ANGAN
MVDNDGGAGSLKQQITLRNRCFFFVKLGTQQICQVYSTSQSSELNDECKI